HREPAGAGPAHETRDLPARGANHPHLTGEEPRDSLRSGTARLPAAPGREADNAACAAALCHLERERTAHRVTDEMGRAHAELVEMALKRIAGVGELVEVSAARVRGSAVVP